VSEPPDVNDPSYPQWYAKLQKVTEILHKKYMRKLAKKLKAQRVNAMSSEFPSIDTPSNQCFDDNKLPAIPQTPLPRPDTGLSHPYMLQQMSPPQFVPNGHSSSEQSDDASQRLSELKQINDTQQQIIDKMTKESKRIKNQNGNLENIAKKQINEISKIDEKLKEQSILLIALREENRKMNARYQQLQKEYAAQMDAQKHLQIGNNEQSSVQLCEDMNAEDIGKWIVGLDVERYSHYYAQIVINMEKEGIDGSCLDELDKDDLYRLGITKFKDKIDVMKKIKTFVRQNKFQ